MANGGMQTVLNSVASIETTLVSALSLPGALPDSCLFVAERAFGDPHSAARGLPIVQGSISSSCVIIICCQRPHGVFVQGPKLDTEPLIKPVLACMQDRTAEIRTLSEQVMAHVVVSVGFARVQNATSSFKKAQLLTLTPLLANVKAKAKELKEAAAKAAAEAKAANAGAGVAAGAAGATESKGEAKVDVVLAAAGPRPATAAGSAGADADEPAAKPEVRTTRHCSSCAS